MRLVPWRASPARVPRPLSRPPSAVPLAAVRAGGALLALAAHLGAQPAAPADSTRTSLTGVTLTAPQQAALRALGARTRGALTALYAQAGARPGAPMPLAARAAFDSVVGANNGALRALLTDDQRAVFDDNVRAVAAAHRAARARRWRQGAAARATTPATATPAAHAGARP